MGQRYTGGPVTYTQMKDPASGSKSSPDPESALTEAMPGQALYEHFLDDDVGGATYFDTLLEFLHGHYFPRLAWAMLTLNLLRPRGMRDQQPWSAAEFPSIGTIVESLGWVWLAFSSFC